MFRLLFAGFLFYAGYRFFKGLWIKESHKEEVKGKQKNQPLDLRDEDVGDAQFEEIENGKH